MAEGNNFETIRRLLTFIFLFWGIMMCALSPCRVFASGSMNPDVNASAEELATFDDDEKATFDQEPAANVSTFLHAEYYQPSVYFPERQKRSVTSHPWMHIIPFAALVMLALATTRLFGRRRQKNSLVVQPDEGIGE